MRTNGCDSKCGNGNNAGCGAAASAASSGHGPAVARGDGSSQTQATQITTGSESLKLLFDPIDDSVSDCPGGVCPVPWAKDTIDMVNHPAHYTDGGIECIEAIEAQLTEEEYRGFLKGNVAKYLWRERNKGGVESLKKAQWYLDRLVNLE